MLKPEGEAQGKATESRREAFQLRQQHAEASRGKSMRCSWNRASSVWRAEKELGLQLTPLETPQVQLPTPRGLQRDPCSVLRLPKTTEKAELGGGAAVHVGAHRSWRVKLRWGEVPVTERAFLPGTGKW